MVANLGFLLLILSFLHLSCSGGQEIFGERRNLELYYRSSPIGGLFLPPIPSWISFSAQASCWTKDVPRYLNIKKIMEQFDLTLMQSIRIQSSFNQKIEQMEETLQNRELSQKKEGALFFSLLNEIKSTQWLPKRVFRISLIWVDGLLERPHRVRKLLKSDKLSTGFPVFLSYCLTSEHLEKWLLRKVNVQTTFELISADFQTIYNEQGEKRPELAVPIQALMKGKEIQFFYPKSKKFLPVTSKIRSSAY